MKRMRSWVAVCLCLCGCEQITPDITWERMLNQSRGKAYRASAFFPDGKLMQAPPLGTVPADRIRQSTTIDEGTQGEAYVSAIPIPVDRGLLARGQNRFELFCATCHGIDGSGESQVASAMERRKPPALVADPVRALEVGRVFHVISAGYGLMPSYAAQLPVRDRWAVVGYLRALQRSQATDLAQLPEALRRQVQARLP